MPLVYIQWTDIHPDSETAENMNYRISIQHSTDILLLCSEIEVIVHSCKNFMVITYITVVFGEVADTDVQILTKFKRWRLDSRFLRDVSFNHVLYEVLAFHLSNVKALGIVISNMLFLCASGMEL